MSIRYLVIIVQAVPILGLERVCEMSLDIIIIISTLYLVHTTRILSRSNNGGGLRKTISSIATFAHKNILPVMQQKSNRFKIEFNRE